MKASYNGVDGDLIIQHCVLLRYNENGKVRKFYQQMLVQFATGAPATADSFWSVSNWGPGAEAPWSMSGDLKGGIKSELQGSQFSAEQTNARQIKLKTSGGYTFYSEFRSTTNAPPPPKLFTELGVFARRSDPQSDHGLRPATPDKNARWQGVSDMRSTVNSLSAIAMHSLMVGDLSAAIAERQELIELISEVRSLQDSAEGQLEMLTLKLAAELKK